MRNTDWGDEFVTIFYFGGGKNILHVLTGLISKFSQHTFKSGYHFVDNFFYTYAYLNLNKFPNSNKLATYFSFGA
jgi:hypothetical protein